MRENMVCVWLCYLGMSEYAEGFLEHGYDDLETVKIMEEEDILVVGVLKVEDRDILLRGVKKLREQGATWVHLLQQEQKLGCRKLSVQTGSSSCDSEECRECIHGMNRLWDWAHGEKDIKSE